MSSVTLMIASNLLAPCQQLTNTLALGELARLDRIHIPDREEINSVWRLFCEILNPHLRSDSRQFQ